MRVWVRNSVFAAAMVVPGMLLSLPAAAWEGCAEGRQTCYEKARRPDGYRTVVRPVVIEPARREIVHERAVIDNRPHRVAVVAPRWQAIREPARTMSVMRRELVRPAQVRYVDKPAVVAQVTETVATRPSRVVWRHSFGGDGGERLCAVRLAGRVATVTRNVVVEPARRVAVTSPAVYHVVARTALVSPAHVRHQYIPGHYVTVTRPVVLKPAATVIVDHPPVVALQEDRVRAHRGGTEWRQVDDHRW